MGRPPLNMKVTEVRFPEETLARIDALVGKNHRAKFIRAATEAALETAEQVKHPALASTKDRA
jgi:metal-responsive CopG/Arc/MetJ family transcriptional regulator